MPMKTLVSKAPEPTEKSIASAKAFLKGASTWHNHQFRAQGFREDGRTTGASEYARMCSGQIGSGSIYFMGDSMAVVFLGEENGGYHSARTLRYNDDPESRGRRWLAYLLGPESPYIQLHPHLTTLDVEETYQQRGFIFKQFDTMPFCIWKCFVIAARFNVEFANHYQLWERMVDAGCNPRAAQLIAVMYSTGGNDRLERNDRNSNTNSPGIHYVGTWSHSAFDTPFWSAYGAIQQRYFAHSSVANGGNPENNPEGPFQALLGDYQADGYSLGFGKYRYGHGGNNKRIVDSLMDPTGYYRHVSGPTKLKIDDLVNTANLYYLLGSEAMSIQDADKQLAAIWDEVAARPAVPAPLTAKPSRASIDFAA